MSDRCAQTRRPDGSISNGQRQEPNLGWRSLPTQDLSTGNLGSEDPGHGSRPSIDNPGGLRLAFDLRADRVVHNVADPAPKRAHVRRNRDTRGDHQAGDGIDGAAIGIGDRSQRHNRIDHIEELWRGHGRGTGSGSLRPQRSRAGSPVPESRVPDTNGCLAPRAAAVAPAACPLRDKSANRQPGRSRIEWLADRSRCWSS